MKKCPNCGAEIADDAMFCTECGKQIPQYNVCPHCGASVSDGDAFCQNCGSKVDEVDGQQSTSAVAPEQKHCPHCGTAVSSDAVFCENCGRNMADGSSVSNRHELYASEIGSQNKFIIPAIIGLLVLALAGGGWWYYKSSNSLQKSVSTDTLVSVDVNSKEYIKNHLDSILPKAIKMEEQQAIKKFFTKEFADLYKKVEVCDSVINAHGNIGFWNFEFWTGGQDGELASINVLDISDLNQNRATALVQYVIKFGDYDESKSSQNIYLVYEDGNWLIDDFNSYKDRFKDYLKNSNLSNNSNSYVGKTYAGSGNGGGLYTEMTITFIDGNKCRCTSDWYQAYPGGKTLNGTYEVKGDHIVVRCAYDGIDYNFNFEVSDNGHSIGFDMSDPEERGTIGTNIMGLELVD